MQFPFVDLRAQYRAIKDKIDAAMARVCELVSPFEARARTSAIRV